MSREDDAAGAALALRPRSARGSSTSLPGSAADGAGAGGSSGGDASAAAAASGGAAAGGGGGGGEVLSRKRAFKEKWQEGVGLFNKKPKKGIALLQVAA
jgi:hypothetical protein